jgi:hypothetical protein
MIHCDEVFEILTRGPFPTGSVSDGIVESHLTRCAECRRLAEALRPAIELFQEAVTPEESHGLPSYWGGSCDVDPWSSEYSEPVEPVHVSRVSSRRPTMRPTRSFRQLAGWAAAMLAGIALASAWSGTESPNDSAVGGLSKVGWRLAESPADWLQRNTLAQACKTPGPEFHAVLNYQEGGDPAKAVRLACCKGCHTGPKQGDAARLPAEILSTCAACHPF